MPSSLPIRIFLFAAVILTVFLRLHADSKNERFQNYITYELSGGRLGDNLIAYLHAKWLSHVHGIPLLYKPFEFSSDMVLSKTDLPIENIDLSSCILHKYRKGMSIEKTSDNISTVYVVHYFPESSWEKTWGTRHNGKSWVDIFDVNWNDSVFKTLAREAITPSKPLKLVIPPENTLSIAIHFREGGGFDTNIDALNLPLKFPPFEFYVEALRTICRSSQSQKIYCYLFTDAQEPGLWAEKIQKAIGQNQNIIIDYRKTNNNHNQNILEDFFSLFTFNILIYPQSNFSMVAALIHNYQSTYTLSSDHPKVNDNYYIVFQP